MASKLTRQLRTTSWQAAKQTGRLTGQAATGLFRWITTDHTGISQTLLRMPAMGFLDTLRYITLQLLITIAGILLTGIWILILIAYGIPYLFDSL